MALFINDRPSSSQTNSCWLYRITLRILFVSALKSTILRDGSGDREIIPGVIYPDQDRRRMAKGSLCHPSSIRLRRPTPYAIFIFFFSFQLVDVETKLCAQPSLGDKYKGKAVPIHWTLPSHTYTRDIFQRNASVQFNWKAIFWITNNSFSVLARGRGRLFSHEQSNINIVLVSLLKGFLVHFFC